MAFTLYSIDFFESIPKTFRQHSEDFINEALINQLFVPHVKYSELSFEYGLHFIRSAP